MSDPSHDMNLTDSADTQGLVFYSYQHSQFAGYRLFRITDRNRFQSWLDGLLTDGLITPAKGKKESGTQALNVAFTASGLECLLGAGWIPDSYDDPFIEGMVTDHRSRLLGDLEQNDPAEWLWGLDRIDGILIAFGADKQEIEARLDLTDTGAGDVHEIIFGDTNPASAKFPDGLQGKEPFGFADGISQPILSGTRRFNDVSKRTKTLHGVPAGEVLLGYPDGTGKLPRTPATVPESDPGDLLQPHWEWPGRRDLGKHGTYLVVRQLAQGVDEFWNYLEAATASGKEAEELGAKLVGRQRDGTPLVPQHQGGAAANNLFDFSDDPSGLQCPLGSHIRRSNPRTFGEEVEKDALRKLKVTNRHRILRRGRVYTDEDNRAVGLLFLCLNASISRQFEFVQSAWCNNQFFAGLDREVDPIIGTVRSAQGGLAGIDRFTVQGAPYRRVLTGLSQFVAVKGGAYFFMPGFNALRCIAQAP